MPSGKPQIQCTTEFAIQIILSILYTNIYLFIFGIDHTENRRRPYRGSLDPPLSFTNRVLFAPFWFGNLKERARLR